MSDTLLYELTLSWLRFEFRSVVSKDCWEATERNNAAIRTKMPKIGSCFFLT